MQWIIANFDSVIGILLMLSEAIAAACQLMYPDNKGVSGIIASVIKVLQTLKAKKVAE